jgi:flagellar motor switch protein FliN
VSQVLDRDFLAACVGELAALVGARLESPARVAPAGAPAGAQWVVRLEAAGGQGGCAIACDEAGAVALATGPAGRDATPDVAACLRDLHERTLERLMGMPVSRGAALVVSDVARLDAPPPGTFDAYTVACERLAHPLVLATWGRIDLAAASPAGATAQADDDRSAPAAAAAAAGADRLEVILDIDLPLTVRFGRTHLPLRSLARLGPGSVIDLGRSPDAPVELLVSDHVIARGEVVVVGGHYGIRILDVVSAYERVRVMEG